MQAQSSHHSAPPSAPGHHGLFEELALLRSEVWRLRAEVASLGQAHTHLAASNEGVDVDMSSAGAPAVQAHQAGHVELRARYLEQFGDGSGNEAEAATPTGGGATPTSQQPMSSDNESEQKDPSDQIHTIRATLDRTAKAISNIYDAENEPSGAALVRLDKLMYLEMQLEGKLSNLVRRQQGDSG